MRVFNLQLPPAPVPNVSVEQFAGLTRRGNVVFGTNGDMMPQPADHARHAMSGNEHADSTFIFSIPAGLAQASERANPTRSNRPTQINPAASAEEAPPAQVAEPVVDDVFARDHQSDASTSRCLESAAPAGAARLPGGACRCSGSFQLMGDAHGDATCRGRCCSQRSPGPGG